MSTFNLHDKVRCVQSDELGLIVGEIYTVIEVLEESPTNQEFIRVDGKDPYGDITERYRIPNRFELEEAADQETSSLFTPLLLALGAAIVKHFFKR